MTRRQVLERYKHLRDDRLRYMEKWGLIRSVAEPGQDAQYGFADLAVIRQADSDLAEGGNFRAVLRSLTYALR